jgi:sodium-dependent phosphate cotransporter
MNDQDDMEKGHDSSRRSSSSSSSSSSSDEDSDDALATNVDDPWAIVEMVDDSEKWKGALAYQKFLNIPTVISYSYFNWESIIDMTTKAKVLRVSINTAKIVTALGLLYFFICSLTLLSDAFRLISGKTAGKFFYTELFPNYQKVKRNLLF